ncbi:MAG: tRNA lysidine(34) synthetase TilS [Pseudomonadota bacterium]
MLKEALQRFFENHSALSEKKTFAIAVSGGSDSMALAHALLSSHPDQTFHILSVNHGLRAEAEAEIEKVKQWSAAFLNAEFYGLKWQGEKPESRIMEAARNARYALMAEHCYQHDIEVLFVGHHQDDQAETILTRIAKGSGLDGLAGMSDLSDYDENLELARPFLSLPKTDLINYCENYKLPIVLDPSNENRDYLRPRLREIKALLEEEGLSSKRLSKLAERMKRSKKALEWLSQQAFDESLLQQDRDHITFKASALMAYPDDIGLRALREALSSFHEDQMYGLRFEKVEDLHTALVEAYESNENMKQRSLGHCFIAYKVKTDEIIIKTA